MTHTVEKYDGSQSAKITTSETNKNAAIVQEPITFSKEVFNKYLVDTADHKTSHFNVDFYCSAIYAYHTDYLEYLAETLQKSADIQVRRRLRSAATSTLYTYRAFPVAAALAWNALP